MQKHLVTLLFIAVMACTWVVSAQTNGPGDAVETTSSGKINWTVGEVYATGIGAPPAQAVNAAQARAMAERAAVVVAYRNLLEIVKGVRVDSETMVENFMTKSDIIRTRVDGIVKGARIVKTQYLSDGSVEVSVAMPLKGALMDTLVPENFGKPATQQSLKSTPMPQRPPDIKQPSKPAEPFRPAVPPAVVPEKKPEPVKPPLPPAAQTPEKKPGPPKLPEPRPGGATPSEEGPTVAFKGGVATGLVLDGRGLGLRPALLPKIVDSQGQELYVGQVATRTNAVEQGVAGYAKDVNAAANNFRVTDNPAVIKGLRASGTARTDIVVGQADAQMLRQLGSKGDFLQYCRVIIVY
jgi:hypothetical protein